MTIFDFHKTRASLVVAATRRSISLGYDIQLSVLRTPLCKRMSAGSVCRRQVHLLLASLVFALKEATARNAESKRGKLISHVLCQVLELCKGVFEAEGIAVPTLPSPDDSQFKVHTTE